MESRWDSLTPCISISGMKYFENIVNDRHFSIGTSDLEILSREMFSEHPLNGEKRSWRAVPNYGLVD